MSLLLVLLFLALILLGVPIAFALLISPTISLGVEPIVSLQVLVQQMFRGVDSFTYLAVPFFVLSGMLMQKGGISKRLIDFSAVLLRKLTGGLAMVVAFASMIFAAITGSGPATTASIGGAVMPDLIAHGYEKKWTVALMAVTGIIGPIIPPSITMVIYGAMTNTSIGAMFLGGIIPGILIGVSLMIMCYFHAKKRGLKPQADPSGDASSSKGELWKTFKDAIWAFFMPVVMLGGILSGLFTPTEAGVISVVYAIIISMFVYRSIKLKDLVPILKTSVITTATIMVIIANANAFAWLLSAWRGAEQFMGALFSITNSNIIILLLMNLLLLILGCFIDTTTAMIMTVPTLLPIATRIGMDPLHFGLMVCINLVIGMATPPLGITLFTACSIGKVSISEVAKPILPMLGVVLIVLLLVVFIPDVSLLLPRLMMGYGR